MGLIERIRYPCTVVCPGGGIHLCTEGCGGGGIPYHCAEAALVRGRLMVRYTEQCCLFDPLTLLS